MDGCLDLLGPLEVSEQTRRELLAQAEEEGDLLGYGAGIPCLRTTCRRHAGAHRRFQRIPVCLTPRARDAHQQEDELWHRRAPIRWWWSLQLTGANDYLNTVIPYTNPLYRDNRPNVGVPEDKVLPIDDTLAFHPNMGPVKRLYDAGKVAIIHGIGYANSPALALPFDGHLAYLRAGQRRHRGLGRPGDPRPGPLGRTSSRA